MATTALILPALLAGLVLAPAKRMQWGVNGHPGVQEGYRGVPVEAQLDLVRQLGAGWYRSDWYQGSFDKDPAPFDRLVAEAGRRKLRILPIIFPTTGCRSDATLEEIEAASFRFARDLARRYRGKVAHWELDNELDCLAMIRKGETARDGQLWNWGDPAGDRPENYEEGRYRKVRAELAGLSAGIKAGNPKAVTIIDTGGWLHTGFVDRLVREDKVPFDILGWHWYSEMGDMTRVQGTLDLVAKLRGYGKLIWVTEINRRGGSQGGKEQEQADYLAGAARQLHGLVGIDAFFAYELLDEPYFGADNPESTYGLAELVRGHDGKWQVGRKKVGFEALQRAFRSP